MLIYKTTNQLNGKIYVGQDSKNDDTYYGSGKYFKRALKKYGKENFKKEILEYCSTKKELDEREVFWITNLNSIEDGYNFATGGQGGNLGSLVAEKKSESLKEYHKNNPEHQTGKKNPRYDGNIHTFHNIKTFEIFVGTKLELMYHMNETHSSCINAVIKGRRNHYKYWILEENKNTITLEKLQEERIRNNPNWVSDIISIEHPERNLVYEGEISAARLVHPEVKTNGLQKLLSGKIKSHSGWILKNN